MPVISLSIGSIVSLNKENYEILEYLGPSEVLIRSTDVTRKLKTADVSELTHKLQTEPSDIDISMIDNKDWQEAKRRFEIIRPIIEGLVVKKNDVLSVANNSKIGIATVYRWIRSYKTTGTISSLISRHKAKGPSNKHMIDEKTEAIVSSLINENYLSSQKPHVTAVYREISIKCKNAGLKPPHINTVRNRIKNIDQKSVAKLRDLKPVKHTRGMPDHFCEAIAPLDVIQIDHTPLDLILVDEATRQDIGRPYLTLAMDVFSRCVYGFYVSFEVPSTFSVGQCLLRGIMPKNELLKQVNVSGTWPVFGLPKSIYSDNGKEFRSIDLQRFTEQYNITLIWRPVARPHYGGHIERLIGSASKEIHTLPGTTFSNIHEKGKYDSSKHASLTINELESWLTEYFINVYHKRIHRAIGMSPEEKYNKGILGDEKTPGIGLPSIPADTRNLRISLLPSEMRTVQKNGITIDYITYFSDVLRPWIASGNSSYKKQPIAFVCKRDIRDISKIYFFDPKLKEYFEIPYRNTTHPHMNIWELRRSIELCKADKKQGVIEEQEVFDAYEKLKSIENNAIYEKKRVRRQNESKRHLTQKFKVDEEKLKPKQEVLMQQDHIKPSFLEGINIFDIEII